MSEVDNTTPFPLNHNQGVPMVIAARSAARDAIAPFQERRDQFLAAADKAVVTDRHTVGSAADLIGLARKVRELVSAERDSIVTPHRDSVTAATNVFMAFWVPVDEAMIAVQDRIDAFAEAERQLVISQQREQAAEETRRRETAVRKQAVEEARIEPAPPAPDLEQPKKRRSYRGDLGFQASIGEVDVIEILNVRDLPDDVLNAGRVKEAIIAVLKPMVKNGMTVSGIKVSKTARSRVGR